jgi:PhzF family phenazine biosynthesis protein
MKLKIFQADAFTDQLFKGNPAAIVPLDEWIPKPLMQQIALENNLAETAFFVKNGDTFDIKWFTPTVEIDLCGHATLASAYILYELMGYSSDVISFNSNSGILKVSRKNDLLVLDFPVAELEETSLPDGMVLGLGSSVPSEIYKAKDDYLAVFDTQADIEKIKPDFGVLKKIAARGIIVSAPGEEVDFVSRFFGPASGIDEDPVTGSAHTKLIPFWADRLGKTALTARQLSARGGELFCELKGNRVDIAGKCKLYLTGEIEVG